MELNKENLYNEYIVKNKKELSDKIVDNKQQFLNIIGGK